MAKYRWIPVYLEPPEYPGLRAGVLIGLHQKDGSRAKVFALISDNVMQTMRRGKADWANTLIEQTINSLGGYLSQHRCFAHWVPDIPGAALGQERLLRAESLEDAIDKA